MKMHVLTRCDGSSIDGGRAEAPILEHGQNFFVNAVSNRLQYLFVHDVSGNIDRDFDHYVAGHARRKF
jgi:hypothetical protein